jgi:hypothetical protein
MVYSLPIICVGMKLVYNSDRCTRVSVCERVFLKSLV